MWRIPATTVCNGSYFRRHLPMLESYLATYAHRARIFGLQAWQRSDCSPHGNGHALQIANCKLQNANLPRYLLLSADSCRISSNAAEDLGNVVGERSKSYN